MIESYRNNEELFNLQCWALTAESFLNPMEWKWLFKKFGYTGYIEFIYFKQEFLWRLMKEKNADYVKIRIYIKH